MKFEEVNKLKIGDTIYSFFGNTFYIYKVTNINIPVHEITVCIESINNIKNGKDYSINIPIEARYNDIKYGYEFTMMDLDLNTAYQNYSEYINTQINRLNGMRANMKGLKRQYMLSMNMDDNDIPECYGIVPLWDRIAYIIKASDTLDHSIFKKEKWIRNGNKYTLEISD
jgi:hypothetical protein